MATRRIKFVWGASRVIKGRWYLGLFGLYDRVEGVREGGFAISVRGLLLWLTGFAVVLYIALATALFWIWQRNPYSVLTYSDALLYPVRRAAITEKKGQAFIAQGQELYRAKKWHDAANLLRLGLARYPKDFKARLTLAQYYVLTNQRPIALRWLQEGLTDEYPGRAYLETLFNQAQQGEDHALVADTSARYVAQLRSSGLATDLRWVLERRFGALLAAGRPAEALAVAETEEMGDTAAEHRVLALLALGRVDDTVAFLQEWRNRPGADVRLVLRLQVRTFREAKKFEEMERALAELRALSPTEPAPLVYAVVQQAMAGRDAAAHAALDDFLFRFAGTAENLSLLAAPLAEIGNLALLQRVAAAASERGFPKTRFQVLLVQTHLQRGEWDAAARILAGIAPERGREAAASQIWRDWTQHLIDCARQPGEAAQTALLQFLREGRWPVSVFRQSVETLLKAGRLEAARDAIALGTRTFPASKRLHSLSESVSAQLAAQTAASSAGNTASVNTPVMSERAFVEKLEELLAARHWAEATRHIQQMEERRPRPAWFESREGLVRFAQVRIAQGQRDFPATVAAARMFLNSDEARAQQLLELAQRSFANGDQDHAVALTREIVRRLPNFAAAKRKLAEWEPGAPQATPAKAVATVTTPTTLAGEVSPRIVPVSAPALDDPAAQLAELKARHASGDVPGTLRVTRLFLNGDQARSLQMLELAREYSVKGDTPMAVTLTNEVLRRAPGFGPAQRLLAELSPAQKK